MNHDGAPVIVYHDGSDERNPGISGSDLYLAVKTGGTWSLELVDNMGDVGKFASLAIDSRGGEHIAYLEWTGSATGVVRYAVRDSEGWHTEAVDDLGAVEIAFLGARRMISIAVGDDDRPHIAYADKEQLRYARRSGDGWAIGVVAEPHGDGAVLGQLASLALATDGTPNIAYYQLPANATSSTGTVYYAVGATPTAVSESAAVPERFRLDPNIPNPFNPTTEISFTLAAPGWSHLAVYNLLGQEVRLLQSGWLEAGRHRITWDGTNAAGKNMATGVYLTLLRSDHRTQARKMLLLR